MVKLTWGTILIVLLAVVAMYDRCDQIERRYCEMVELWEVNKHLPPAQRPGWPPYKGACKDDD